MLLMTALGVMLAAGIVLTLRWGGVPYQPWYAAPADSAEPPSLRTAAMTYLRGVAVALAGGFWAGALVTGPAVRLIMRLLAVTAGERAQGLRTEADEVVGQINLDGTMGLFIFGGVLPALLSGAIYVVVRRWLPAGRTGGVVFGVLHLVLAATHLDPLRPGNRDFGLVGPGWLSVLTFGAAAVFHGMAVVAFANRFSTTFPPATAERSAWVRSSLPLALPALFAIFTIFIPVAIAIGLVVALLITRLAHVSRIARSPRLIRFGRVAITLAALGTLPGTVSDLVHIITA
ncbi:MAG: hypothetical protein ABI808_16135 [Pseudonocardiales bacterium]